MTASRLPWIVRSANGHKTYIRLPFRLGEVEYGRLTHRVTVWFRGRRIRILR
jgi:hypothetical protein